MNIYMKLRCRITIILVAAIGVCINGCAGVTFYSDATLMKRTGIPIYAPKPYLLIARTGANDKPVDVSIVYLNDTQNVIYAEPRSGLGSSNLTLSLENGKMASFGQQADTKIPELITSLGGLLTSRATALKTEAEAAQIRAGIGTMQAGESTSQAGMEIVAIGNDMLAKIDAKEMVTLTGAELTTVGSAAHSLKLAGTALSDAPNAPTAPQNIQTVEAQLKALSSLPPSTTAGTSRDKALQLIEEWCRKLSTILDSLQTKIGVPLTFELYEIIQGPGQTTLRKVTP